MEVVETDKCFECIAVTPQDMEDAVRWVVEHHQYLLINGVALDGFTAQHVIQIIDGLSESNKIKFCSMPLVQMVDITWKLFKKLS